MSSQSTEFTFRYVDKRSANQIRYDKCKEKFFVIFNWLTVLVITSLSFFTGINQGNVQTWNMSLYCDVEKFNKSVSTTSKIGAVVTILTLVIATFIMMCIRMFMRQKMGRDLLIIANYFIGFLICWDIVYILQSTFSYPVPSFYSNDLLKWHYCCNDCPTVKYDRKLEKLDIESRGCFPSFLICALCYTTVFFYLFTCYMDHTKNYVAQLITLIGPGFITVTYGWLMWSNNENHIEDLLAGGFLGSFMAMYIMKDLFIEPSKWERIRDDFITVLVTRDMVLAERNRAEPLNNEGIIPGPEFTISLCSGNDDETPQESVPLADQPPPYSSCL